MEKYISSTILREIFGLRLVIARAGEQDSLAWWNSYALTKDGQWALGRLYPRYAAYAGARLALEAAVIIHAQMVGHRRAVTLFGLGADLDARVTRQLDLLRLDDEPLTIGPPIRSPGELRAQLSQAVELTEEDLTLVKSTAINGSLIELGAMKGADLWSADKLGIIIRRLAAAYTISEFRRLIVPYYRIEG